MGKQVEALEHHAGYAPLARDLGFAQRMQRLADDAVAGQFAVEPDGAGIDALELVDASKKRGLAGTRWADDADHLARHHIESDILERSHQSEELPDPHRRHERLHRVALDVKPRPKRFSSIAWNTDSTETTMRYQKAATISSSMTLALV